MDGQELPEDPDHDGQTDSCLSSGPTKYKPPSDSGDSAAEVPLVPTTKDKIKKKWSIIKKPAASKVSSKATVKAPR